jgi:hypothetical protein
MILLIMLLGFSGCAKRVSSWRDIEGAKTEITSNESMKLVFNIDSDSYTQFQRLSKANKINYISYWCLMPTDFQNKTGVTNFSEAIKVVNYDTERKMVFYFNEGNNFTILIGAVRGSKW